MARREDTYFMRDLDAVMRRRPRIAGNLLLFGIIAFFVWAVYWANGAELDQVTSGEGQVIPSSQIQIVQNLEGGIIEAIYVAEGDAVAKNDILMRLDDTQFASKFSENRATLYGLQAVIARLEAEIEGKPLELPQSVIDSVPMIARNERSLYESRTRELEATVAVFIQQTIQKKQELVELGTRIKQLERSLELAERELKIKRPLVVKGIFPEVDLISLEREHNEIRGTLETSRQAIPRIEAGITEVTRKISEARAIFRSSTLKELNEAQVKSNALTELLESSQDRVRRTEVRAPVDGTIKRVLINTIGGVVRGGMDLIEIVPRNDKLLVEAKIRPSDIAFLHPGQEATVKIAAYDFSIYGSLPATLVHISADTIVDEKNESYYIIRVLTDRTDLGDENKSLPIIAGMTATVDILVGKRTVLEYLLKPILRGREKALRER